MSIGVMLIGGAALCYALWKFWGIIKGKNQCGCDNGNSSCSGCDQKCPSKK